MSASGPLPVPPGVKRRALHAQFVKRLLWPLVIAFVLAATITALVAFHAEKRHQSEQRMQTLAIFARSLVKPLWDCDAATARGIVETLIQQPGVRGVRLYDACAAGVLDVGERVAGLASADPDMLQIPVGHRDETGREFSVGHLAIQFQPFSIASAVTQGLWQQLAIFGSMLVVMLAGAVLVFRSLIGQPLARFRQAILAHRAVYEKGQQPGRYVNELTEVTLAYDELVRELRRLVRHDPLTGLGNRVELEEALSKAVARAGADGKVMYVLLLDLDGFKPINDTHGHAVGDVVLRVVAQRLQQAMRSADTVARLGGDEFVVIAHSRGQLSGRPDSLLARVVEAVEAPIEHEGRMLQVGASVGVASFPDDGVNSAQLLARADQTMYEAKQGKRAAPGSRQA